MRVFLSYSRGDTAIADRMVADLEARGIDVDIDRRDLPYGEEWQDELAGFIRRADTVVWLASAASVTSHWCKWELGEAQRASKRVLPVRISALAPEDLPEALGRIHILPVEGSYDPARHLDDLVAAIETNRAWIEMHTRLSDRAGEWIARGRAGDRLLRGRALRDAEDWRDGRPERAPAPSSEALDLILQSRRAAGRRLRALVAIVSTALVVTVALAVLALVQADEARTQRDVARTAQQQAVARAREVELQGARLSATLAPILAADGQVDPALLLLLDAQRVYGDEPAPVELETAFHQVLELAHRRTAHTIPLDSVPFSTADALYLFDPQSADLWAYDGSAAPRRILAGQPDDQPILALGTGPDGLLLLRADLAVEAFDLQTSRTRQLGTLPRPPEYEGTIDLFDEVAFYPDGTVTFRHGADGALRLLDTASGARLTVPQPSVGPVFYHASDDGLRLVIVNDGPPTETPPAIWQLVATAAALDLVPLAADLQLANEGLFARCLRRGGGAAAPYSAVIEAIAWDNALQMCWPTAYDGLLLSEFTFSSTGLGRVDRLFTSDGQVLDLADRPAFARHSDQFGWLGVSVEAASIAGIINRDLAIITLDDADDFVRRESETPVMAKLFADKRIALVEPRSGRLVIHDYGGAGRESLVHASSDAILAGELFTPLNTGTCVGYALMDEIDRKVAMPDGAQLLLLGGTSTSVDGPSGLQLPDGRGIKLGEERSCVQVSPDQRTILVHADGIALYDLPMLLAGAGPDEARRPAPPGSFSSVFPLADGGLLTTNWTEQVRRWSLMDDGGWASALVYSSESRLFYAEPNADGSQLILLEYVGDGDTHGLLYSVTARSKWLDLGTDYKWLGAAFGKEGEILTTRHFMPTQVWRLPERAELAREAAAYLPDHCATGDDAYRASPCWPDWL